LDIHSVGKITMRLDRTLTAMAVVVLAGLPSAVLHAQTASTPLLTGPVVPNVCLLSREEVFARSKVGIAASARLKQLAEQAQSDIDNEGKPIQADMQSYRAQASSLSADQRAAREQSLSQRMQQLQADQALRSRELQATQLKARDQIAQYAQPVIASAYTGRNCGLLLDRNAVLGGNMANDLTPTVVQGLDAKVTTITFNMETLPASSAQGTTP
jgi:Skp family chaperone for outer membrane proteins